MQTSSTSDSTGQPPDPLQQAEQVWSQILQVDPNRADALHALGAMGYQRGEYNQAIAWLGKAAAVQPNNAILQSNLGASYRAAGRFQEAEACYAQALRLKPDFAEAYNNLGNVLKLQARLQEAIGRYQQAVLARPNYAEAHHNWGLALQELEQPEEALGHFQQAARLRPDFAEAHSSWGLLVLKQGRVQEAVLELRQALRLGPAKASDYVNLAAAFQSQENLAEAVICLREAIARQPDLAEAHYSLGIVLSRENRLDEAAACCEQALRLKPSLLEVHTCLGMICLKQGQLDQAIVHFTLAPRLKSTSSPAIPSVFARSGLQKPEKPARTSEVSETSEVLGTDDAAAHLRLALTLKKQRKLDEAVAQCREALRLDPESAEVQETLGGTLADQGRLEEAVMAFHQALRIQPDRVQTYVSLGKALIAQGRLDKAVSYVRHALDLRPDLAEAHCQMALALADQGKPSEAVSAFRESLRLRPDSVLALSHLGILLEETGRPEEGRVLVEQALSLEPRDVQARLHYGTSLVNQGRFAEAKDQFLEILAQQPDFAAAYFLLARDSDHSFSAAQISHLQELLGRQGLPLRDRVSLHFTLARVFDRAGAVDEAFQHCHQGNACKQKLLELQGNTFRPQAHAQFVDRLQATFTREYFQRAQGCGSASDLPVFIVGMPRSGTSLVEQILASHSAVFAAGELNHLKQFSTDLPAELGSPAEYPECLSRLDQASGRRLADQYVAGLRRLGGDRPRITDKMPMNFHHLGLIATLWPRAPIIHCRRDLRDVCWSCYFQNFRDVHFACDLTSLAGYARQYERLMAHWTEVLPVPILEVHYEDVVTDLEKASRRIVEFCGLPWQETCLNFYATRRTVRTASNRQVRQPLYTSSVGYWKNYQRHLGPLLEALGKCY
jgi:tetratricopeptide (TPR) repeat protein